MAFPISCGNYFGSWCQLDTLPCPPTYTKECFFLLKNFHGIFLRSFFEQHLQGLFWWMTQVVSSQGEVRHRVECMPMVQVTLQTHRSVNIQSALKMNLSSLIGLSLIQVNAMENIRFTCSQLKWKTGKWQTLSYFQLYVTIQCLTISLRCLLSGTS